MDIKKADRARFKRIRRPHRAPMIKLLGRYMMRDMEGSWREVERRFKSGAGGDTDEPAATPHPGA